MAKKYFYTEVAIENCPFRRKFTFNVPPVCVVEQRTCTDPSKCPYGKELKDILL